MKFETGPATWRARRDPRKRQPFQVGAGGLKMKGTYTGGLSWVPQEE